MNILRENDVWVRQNWLFDLGVEVRHFHFDVLRWQHVLAERARLRGDLVEQVRVHIGADAKAKDAGLTGIYSLDRGKNLFLAEGADGRLAVREEDDDIGLQRQCLDQRLFERRAADRLEVFDELAGALPVLVGGLDQLFKQRLGLGGEAEDLELVGVVQVFDAELQGLLRLREFVAGHRAAGVEDKDDVFLHDLFRFQLAAWRREQ